MPRIMYSIGELIGAFNYGLEKTCEKILRQFNKSYHEGESEIEDEFYDILFGIFSFKYPKNPFLEEVGFKDKTPNVVIKKLPELMLSTKKAYSLDVLKKWLVSVEKAANKLDIDTASIQYKLTTKLDGWAIYDDVFNFYAIGGKDVIGPK